MGWVKRLIFVMMSILIIALVFWIFFNNSSSQTNFENLNKSNIDGTLEQASVEKPEQIGWAKFTLNFRNLFKKSSSYTGNTKDNNSNLNTDYFASEGIVINKIQDQSTESIEKNNSLVEKVIEYVKEKISGGGSSGGSSSSSGKNSFDDNNQIPLELEENSTSVSPINNSSNSSNSTIPIGSINQSIITVNGFQFQAGSGNSENSIYPEYTFDGNLETGWCGACQRGDCEIWWQINFDGELNFNKINFAGSASESTYIIEYSLDGALWNNAGNITLPNSMMYEITFPDLITAKNVRIRTTNSDTICFSEVLFVLDDEIVLSGDCGFGCNDSFICQLGTCIKDQPVVLYAINAGGDSYMGNDGINYAADSFFSGGSALTYANPVSGTLDDYLYVTERFGNFSYLFPLNNGKYEVILKFMEGSVNQINERSFNVYLEESLVLETFDIFSIVGSNYAYDKTFNISINDGSLDLVVLNLTNNSKIGAIIIKGLTGSIPVCTPESFLITCSDLDCGLVSNNCKESIDCGSCEVSACQNGIQDGNEEGVDCGGSCHSCIGPFGWTVPSSTVPLRILFLGNSFTNGGPVPYGVQEIAAGWNWPTPFIINGAINSQSLSYHRSNPESLAFVDQGEWDIVVLQGYSTRPTDSIYGNPSQFKDDVTWFYDRIKNSSPNARIVLFETWARHPNHDYYPSIFLNPSAMQEQLRNHYNDAAYNYIPANAEFIPANHTIVAPIGDAWERHLTEQSSLLLHESDLYHASANGQYLTSLMLYATIYGCAVNGSINWNIPSIDNALRLQAVIDGMTSYPVC